VRAHVGVELVHAGHVVEEELERRGLCRAVVQQEERPHPRLYLAQQRQMRAVQRADRGQQRVLEHHEIPHVAAGVDVLAQHPLRRVNEDALVRGVARAASFDQTVDPLLVAVQTPGAYVVLCVPVEKVLG